MNLTSALARPKSQEEYRLEGQMLPGGLLDWIKWSLRLLAGARPVSSRRVCHSCLWFCLRGNYPGDERDFRLADVEG